jgi:hypothetical protein
MIAGGLVWVTNSSGTLYGLDPTSGTTRSQFAIPENSFSVHDPLEFVNHFASPSAGGGRLFVASGDQVTAYTIAQPPASTAPVSSAIPAPAGGSPVISHASIAPRRFRTKHGATLRLTLNEAAALTLAVTQLRHGHLISHRCRVKARSGKSCLALVTLVRLHLRARRGRNAFKLWLRRLAPGPYTAFINAADQTGRRSRTIRITFTIIRAQR